MVDKLIGYTLHDIVAAMASIYVVTVSVISHFINNKFSLTEVCPVTNPTTWLYFLCMLHQERVYLGIRGSCVSFQTSCTEFEKKKININVI
jgi:hypothetical protein